MSKWVRSGALAKAADLVADLHGQFSALAADAGLRAESLANADFPIEAAAVPRFLDLASERLGCPSFSLQLGQRQDMSLFGPLGLLIRRAANVGDLMHNLADFFPLHTQGAIVALSEEAGQWLMTYDLAAGVYPSHRHVVELGFSVLVAEIRRHSPDWRPTYMAFRHSPPSDRRWHDRLFGQKLLFNADRNALMLDAALLAQPVRAGDVNPGHASSIARPGPDITDFVPFYTERVVRASLPSRLLTVDETARLLRLSTRSFQRCLAASGTSFEAIVDAVRADLAFAYLRDSDLTVAQIAETLRFSETSAMSRAVRRWHGRTPRELRHHIRPG